MKQIGANIWIINSMDSSWVILVSRRVPQRISKLNWSSVLSVRLKMTTFVTHFDGFFILILFFDVSVVTFMWQPDRRENLK